MNIGTKLAPPPMPAQQYEITTPELVNSSPEFILKLASDICEAYSKKDVGNGGIKPELAGAASKILLTILTRQDVLDKPAQVGSGIFHAGVKTRLVVEAAQRLYENNSCNGD